MACPHCGSGQLVMGLAAAPKRGQIRATIARLIRSAGPQGLTVEDLKDLTKLEHQTVSARVHDLWRAGEIEQASARHTRSGRPAWAWRAVDAAAAEASR